MPYILIVFKLLRFQFTQSLVHFEITKYQYTVHPLVSVYPTASIYLTVGLFTACKIK